MTDPLKELREARQPFSFHYGGQPGDRCACCQCKLITAIDKALDTPPPTGEVGEAHADLEKPFRALCGLLETDRQRFVASDLGRAIDRITSLRPSLSHPEEITYEGKTWKLDGFGPEFVERVDPDSDEEFFYGALLALPCGKYRATVYDHQYFWGALYAGAALYRLKPVEPIALSWTIDVSPHGRTAFTEGVGFSDAKTFGKQFKVTAVEIMEEENGGN